MPVRIRLQRHGRKGKPFYWIVAADSRAKRDGKFLEKLGTYDPIPDPARISLDVDGSVKWLRNGAQPSETARRILSYKGALLKHHLLRGVDKGALTPEQAEEKFQSWLAGKVQKIEDKKEFLAKTKADARAKALEAEKEADKKRKVVVEAVETSETTGENPVEATDAGTEIAATPEATEAAAPDTAVEAAEAAPEEAPAADAGEDSAPEAKA
ncbi:MAG: 30S ribosomal protein S16 [Sinomicrobium sp.]|nr:30S ribosomal protein S16 [Sinomicrobium sp.]